jgi:hypothetical protein
MAHDALGGYGGHVLVGVVDALATFEPQGKRNRGGEIFRVGGRQFVVGVGHSAMVAPWQERSKNNSDAAAWASGPGRRRLHGRRPPALLAAWAMARASGQSRVAQLATRLRGS